jgi:hypothetical protein
MSKRTGPFFIAAIGNEAKDWAKAINSCSSYKGAYEGSGISSSAVVQRFVFPFFFCENQKLIFFFAAMFVQLQRARRKLASQRESGQRAAKGKWCEQQR